MKKIWSWLNEDKTEIVRTWETGSEPISLPYPDKGGQTEQTSNHPDSVLIASGALLHDYPDLGTHERHGELKIESDRISKEIIPWTQEEIDAESIQIKAALIAFCKAEAKSRIVSLLDVSPGADYRDVESNMLARMGELLDYKIDFPLEDHVELNSLKEIWAGIKEIRIASNVIEPDIESGLIETEDQISTDERWPAEKNNIGL